MFCLHKSYCCLCDQTTSLGVHIPNSLSQNKHKLISNQNEYLVSCYIQEIRIQSDVDEVKDTSLSDIMQYAL